MMISRFGQNDTMKCVVEKPSIELRQQRLNRRTDGD